MVSIAIDLISTVSQIYRFGEDSVQKMVDWALDNVPPETSSPSVLE